MLVSGLSFSFCKLSIHILCLLFHWTSCLNLGKFSVNLQKFFLYSRYIFEVTHNFSQSFICFVYDVFLWTEALHYMWSDLPVFCERPELRRRDTEELGAGRVPRPTWLYPLTELALSMEGLEGFQCLPIHTGFLNL